MATKKTGKTVSKEQPAKPEYDVKKFLAASKLSGASVKGSTVKSGGIYVPDKPGGTGVIVRAVLRAAKKETISGEEYLSVESKPETEKGIFDAIKRMESETRIPYKNYRVRSLLRADIRSGKILRFTLKDKANGRAAFYYDFERQESNSDK